GNAAECAVPRLLRRHLRRQRSLPQGTPDEVSERVGRPDEQERRQRQPERLQVTDGIPARQAEVDEERQERGRIDGAEDGYGERRRTVRLVSQERGESNEEHRERQGQRQRER